MNFEMGDVIGFVSSGPEALLPGGRGVMEVRF